MVAADVELAKGRTIPQARERARFELLLYHRYQPPASPSGRTFPRRWGRQPGRDASYRLRLANRAAGQARRGQPARRVNLSSMRARAHDGGSRVVVPTYLDLPCPLTRALPSGLFRKGPILHSDTCAPEVPSAGAGALAMERRLLCPEEDTCALGN
ncbi:hypothetical protein BDY21DRAFT_359330 [Lineolata rhizophorae]|uniref:Uncharacterized protein n=1 Tax=Lineolata rhizophorae TaxID=578093 RepID=A0A6A6NL43_9PEZI|nr:hypothetical protein BDY21DRAFT_359330 [Lineolata rhizophorae]